MDEQRPDASTPPSGGGARRPVPPPPFEVGGRPRPAGAEGNGRVERTPEGVPADSPAEPGEAQEAAAPAPDPAAVEAPDPAAVEAPEPAAFSPLYAAGPVPPLATDLTSSHATRATSTSGPEQPVTAAVAAPPASTGPAVATAGAVAAPDKAAGPAVATPGAVAAPDKAAAPAVVAPEDDAPTMRGGHRHRRTRVVLAGVLVLVFLMVSSAGALLLYGRGSIERADILGMGAIDRLPLILPDGESVEIMNVLLIGSDDRDNLDDETRQGMRLEDRSIGRRPDTIMLAQLELGGKGAALLSFPRDLRIELCDGTTDKINAAFTAGARTGVGGESCLVQTVTNHTGIEIHHYAEVDFDGFLKVIDILGGVTMYLDQPMVDSKAHLNVPAGCVTLTPEQALGFVRSRGYDDDFGRIARQQRFIREVVEELTQIGVIANPAKLFALVDAGANAVTTDREFGLGVMREVASGARRLTSDRLITHTVPADNERIGGTAYVVERPDEASPLYASFVDATVLRPQPPEPEPTPEPVVVPPLVILNSTGTAGLAAVAAEVLEAEGYEIAEVGNAEARDLEVTEVVHVPDQLEAAEEVAAALPGAVLRADEDVEGVQVVLGADVDAESLRALLTEEPPAPEPTPEPTPTPERTFRGADPGDVDC